MRTYMYWANTLLILSRIALRLRLENNIIKIHNFHQESTGISKILRCYAINIVE